MTEYIKEPHTAMFIGQMKCGKTHLVLDLTENQYNKQFDYIMVICPTLRENNTYYAKEWIKNDDNVWLVEPTKDNLYQWIKKLPELLRFLELLFIIDGIIANECLDKRKQPLLELSISGRRRGHYLWLLTQFDTAIPKSLRKQAKAFFVWYPKERAYLRTIHHENDALTDNELFVARGLLRESRYVRLYIRNEYPRGFRMLHV